MTKKWQTTVYVPTEYKEGVKTHKLDLSRIVTEQISYILGGACNTGIMCPTVDKIKAKEAIRTVVVSLIDVKYDGNRVMRWLPEADIHGDYEDRMMGYVRDVQKNASIDGFIPEILVFTRDYLATRDTPT